MRVFCLCSGVIMVCRFVSLCNLCLIQNQSIFENALGGIFPFFPGRVCTSWYYFFFNRCHLLGKMQATVLFVRVFLTMDFISSIDIELFRYSFINDFSNYFLKKLYTPCKIYNLWFFIKLFYYTVIFA